MNDPVTKLTILKYGILKAGILIKKKAVKISSLTLSPS